MSFQRRAETIALYNRLMQVELDQIVTYAELTLAAGLDVREHRGLLYTARRMARDEDSRVFGIEYKIGLRLLLDSDRVLIANEPISRHIRHTTRKRINILTSVKYDGLQPGEKLTHNALLSASKTIEHFSRQKTIGRLEQVVQSATAASLPIKETLRLFAGTRR